MLRLINLRSLITNGPAYKMSKGSDRRKEDTKRVTNNLEKVVFKERCKKCHKHLNQCECRDNERD